MSDRRRRPSNGARLVLGLAGGLAAAAGLGYATQRALVRRLRSRPDPDAARVLALVARTGHDLPSHDGGTIHVVEAGEGPPIVLSHGVTLSARTWVYQLASLPEAGFRALAYDHRGHGQSVAGEEGHSIAALGDDLRTVLEELDLEDAVLVGHSMGGVAVQSFVARYPDVARRRVRGIVLLSTLARTPLGSRPSRFKDLIEDVTERLPDTTRLWAAPNFGLLLARVGFGRDARPSHVELVRRMMLECPADTRREAPRCLLGLDLTAELPQFDVPTLVVSGTSDVLTPPVEARRLVQLIPGARLELMPGGGHMLMLEQAEAFDRLLVEFARECGRRAERVS